MDYEHRLQRLAINDARLTEDDLGEVGVAPGGLEPKPLALARIAALVAMGGAEPSFGALVDAAVSTGATPDEIVDVVVGVSPVTGLPRVVAAAPKVALALGADVDDMVGDVG